MSTYQPFPAKYTFEGMVQTRAIRRNAACIFVAVTAWLLLRSLLPNILLSGATMMMTAARVQISQETAMLIYNAVDILSTVISMAVPFFVMMRVIDIPTRIALPFGRIRSGFNIGSLFIALAASTVGVYTGSAMSSAAAALGFSPRLPQVDTPTDLQTGIWYTLIMVIVPAFLEEMVFRGAILQPLRRFGDGFAIVVSSVLFSLSHLNLYQIPNAFIMGLLMGYFVVRSGSLWAGIIIHFVNNGVAALFEYFSGLVTPFGGYLMSCLLYIFYLGAGIAALIVTARRSPKLFMLYRRDGALTVSERYRCYFTSASTVILLLVLLILTLYSMI